MTKRKKKYNPRKEIDLVVNSMVKNLLLVSLVQPAKCKKVNAFNAVTKKQVNITPLLASTISKHSFEWTTFLVVYSQESNGKERNTVVQTNAPYPCVYALLVPSLNQQHNYIIASEKAKGNTVFNAGWVCVPKIIDRNSDETNEEYSELVLEILKQYGKNYV